jgi:hypothetical protein
MPDRHTFPRKWSRLTRISDGGAFRHSVGGKVAVSINGAEVLPSRHGSDGAMLRRHLHCYVATAAPDLRPLRVREGPVSPGSRFLNPRHGTRESVQSTATYCPSASRHIPRWRSKRHVGVEQRRAHQRLTNIPFGHPSNCARRMLGHLVHAEFATQSARPARPLAWSQSRSAIGAIGGFGPLNIAIRSASCRCFGCGLSG